MSDPERLIDDPSTPAELHAALEAGREELPTDAQLASLESRLAPLLGPGGGGAGPSPFALAAKAAGGLAAAAVVGGVVWWGVEAGSPAPGHRAEVEARDAGASAVEPPPGVDVPEELAVELRTDEPREAPSPAPRPRPVSAAEIDPEAELAIVREAQDALRVAPVRALRLTDEHRRRFAGGTLAQEREVIAIEALVRLGRRDDARARAAAFADRWPSSAHRRRIEVLVADP